LVTAGEHLRDNRAVDAADVGACAAGVGSNFPHEPEVSRHEALDGFERDVPRGIHVDLLDQIHGRLGVARVVTQAIELHAAERVPVVEHAPQSR
jgi:hypothetical protein